MGRINLNRQFVERAISVSLAEADASVDVLQGTAGSSWVKTKHDSFWPVLAIFVGMTASLVWCGFLGWLAYRVIIGLL
jgi:hypothetical protein